MPPEKNLTVKDLYDAVFAPRANGTNKDLVNFLNIVTGDDPMRGFAYSNLVGILEGAENNRTPIDQIDLDDGFQAAFNAYKKLVENPILVKDSTFNKDALEVYSMAFDRSNSRRFRDDIHPNVKAANEALDAFAVGIDEAFTGKNIQMLGIDVNEAIKLGMYDLDKSREPKYANVNNISTAIERERIRNPEYDSYYTNYRDSNLKNNPLEPLGIELKALEVTIPATGEVELPANLESVKQTMETLKAGGYDLERAPDGIQKTPDGNLKGQ